MPDNEAVCGEKKSMEKEHQNQTQKEKGRL
jgi:hypothetical protein